MEVPRGGETTYHGPGQIIAYPIVHLRQLRLGPRVYVEALEDAMIATAKDYGVKSKVRRLLYRLFLFVGLNCLFHVNKQQIFWGFRSTLKD